MKNMRVFLSEKFQFLEVKFSLYLNRHVFVMNKPENSISYRLACAPSEDSDQLELPRSMTSVFAWHSVDS